MTVISMLALALTLGAQEPRCDAQTFAAMYQCAVDRYRRAHAEQQRVFRETAARLEPEPRGKLRAAEQLWERFREAECDFRSSRSAGRREYQVVRLRCLAELTEARTASLRAENAEDA
jgi:uncharacterized protein YecT (DUF1311 family)